MWNSDFLGRLARPSHWGGGRAAGRTARGQATRWPYTPAVIDRRYRFTRQNKWHQLVLTNPGAFVWHVALVANDTVLNFELSRRGADVDKLVRQLHKLGKIQRPVIQRAGQTKSIVDQHCLARLVPFIHPTDLRNGRVRLIDHGQKIFREEIDDSVGL